MTHVDTGKYMGDDTDRHAQSAPLYLIKPTDPHVPDNWYLLLLSNISVNIRYHLRANVWWTGLALVE